MTSETVATDFAFGYDGMFWDAASDTNVTPTRRYDPVSWSRES